STPILAASVERAPNHAFGKKDAQRRHAQRTPAYPRRRFLSTSSLRGRNDGILQALLHQPWQMRRQLHPRVPGRFCHDAHAAGAPVPSHRPHSLAKNRAADPRVRESAIRFGEWASSQGYPERRKDVTATITTLPSHPPKTKQTNQ